MAEESFKEQITSLRDFREECKKMPVFGKRTDISGVDCIVHVPKTDKTDLPLFCEIHGGTWIGGDAALLDSLCKTISEHTPAVCVNINYKKLDEHPFPYPMDEVIKVLEYFKANAKSFGINPNKMVICGQSAGGHIAAGAAVLARDRSIAVSRQILVYPFLDWSGKIDNPLKRWFSDKKYKDMTSAFFDGQDQNQVYLSPLAAENDELVGIAPCDIIVCGNDELKVHGIEYYNKLKSVGIETSLKEYKEALHGFIEVNREDYPFPGEVKNEKQDVFARDCEKYIVDILQNI